jgi:GrpB-like predicted nucleotidyltransferase (UPF0157 family)
MTGLREPEWAFEPVVILPYQSEWPSLAIDLIRLIKRLAGTNLIEIEHIGSTSVPGLSAKPIIDLMAKFKNFESIDSFIADNLLQLPEWNFVPTELDERPWRRFCVMVKDSHRFAHLHLVPINSERWDQHIAFREILKKDEHLRNEYQDLKNRLAKELGNDREAYTEAKAQFIVKVLST